MANNITLNAGSGGDTIATEDISGVEYQIIKIADGDATSVSTLKVASVDEASGGSDTGIALLAVRDDALTSLTPVDGDYTQLRVDSTGALWVRASGVVTQGSTTYTEGSSTGSAIAFVRNDVLAALADTDNEFAPGQVNALGALFVQDAPNTTGGLSIFRSIDLDESEEEVKASAGMVYSIHCTNSNASDRYLKFYNATAASVTVGTTTPVMTFLVPGGSAGFVWNIDKGLAFGTAITVAATTGVADSDAGAPGANEILVNIGYR